MATTKKTCGKEKALSKGDNMLQNFYPGILNPSEVIGGAIAIYENAWPDSDKLIPLIEEQAADPYSNMSWNRAETVGQGIYQNARTNLHMGITYSAECGNVFAQSLHNQFYMTILAATSSYCPYFGISELYPEGYGLLRYENSQEYKGHSDGNASSGRCVSVLCYLNEDYIGGELEFEHFRVKIKPEKGMLILFPSNYPYKHIAHPVTEGIKYAMVTWMHDSPIRK